MPEGPEIRQAADRLDRAVGKRICTEVYFEFERLKVYEPELTGQAITQVTSRGKAMLTRFANGWSIYSHNQLYGRWMVRKPYVFPQTNRQLRLALHTEHRSALLYSASDIDVLRTEEEAQHPFLQKLGPDLLDPATTVEVVTDRFTDRTFRRRQLGSLLLDQGFLAGLGNYLRSEILFVARRMPQQQPQHLAPESLQRLATACLDLTRQSYQSGGITNDLDAAQALHAQGFSRSQYRHWVFARERQPCWTCTTPIERIDCASRRLYFCPSCQATTP